MDTSGSVTKKEVPSSSSRATKKVNAPIDGAENDEASKDGDGDNATMILSCASNDRKDGEERGDDDQIAEQPKQNTVNSAGNESKTDAACTGKSMDAKSAAASTLHTLITNLQRRQLQQQKQQYKSNKACVDEDDDSNSNANHVARRSAFTFAAHASVPADGAANSFVKNSANQLDIITHADIIAAAGQQQNSEVESSGKCKGTSDATKIALNRSSITSSSDMKKVTNLMGGPAVKRIRRMNNNNNHAASGAVSTLNNTASRGGNTSAITFPISNSSTSRAASKSTSAELLSSLTALNSIYSSLTNLNGALTGNCDNVNGTGLCSRKLSSLTENKSNNISSSSDTASSPAVNSLEYLLQMQNMYQTTLLNNMLLGATSSNGAAASSPASTSSSSVTITPTNAHQLSANATAMLLRMQHLNALQQAAALTHNLNTAANTQQIQQQLLFPFQSSCGAAGNNDSTAGEVGAAFTTQLQGTADLAGRQAVSSSSDSRTGGLSPSASSLNSLFLSAPSLFLQQQNAPATAMTNNPFILAAALDALPSSYNNNNNEMFNESTTNKGIGTSNQPSSQFDAATATLFCNLMLLQQQQQYASSLPASVFPSGLLSGSYSNSATDSDRITANKQTLANSSNTPQNITDSRCVGSDVNMSTNELLLSALAAARMNATAGDNSKCKGSSKNEKSATTSLPTKILQQTPICRRTLEARFARILAQELEAASDEEHHDIVQLNIIDNANTVSNSCGDKDGTDKDDEILIDDDKIDENIVVNEKKNSEASDNGDSKIVDVNETSRNGLIMMDNEDASGVITSMKEGVDDSSVIDAKLRNDNREQHLLLLPALMSSDRASEALEDGSDDHHVNTSSNQLTDSSQFSSVISSKSDDISRSSSDQRSSSPNSTSTSTQSDVAKTPALVA
ncbi:unnamed protein product [Anisakis simplex]|uniref:Homeobox protein prospero n=1 Tax=Anisakis simplex TaxID=6269 RepID=A0A0M3JUV4_ANISI|nr:unnamed protein product [Anisakis simplex]